MNIPIFASVMKKKTGFIYFIIVTLLLLIVVSFVNGESDAKNNPVKGVIIDVQSRKDPRQCDIYFVDEHGNMQNLTSFPDQDWWTELFHGVGISSAIYPILPILLYSFFL